MKLIPILAISALTLYLTACNKTPHLTPQERTVVSELTAKLGTHCVGRYLIDMPEGVLSFGRIDIERVAVEATPMKQDDYQRAMVDREAALKAARSVLGYRFLYEYGEAQPKGSRYFIHLRSEEEPSDVSRFIEAYKWDSGYQIKLEIEATDYTHSKFKDEPVIKNSPFQNDVPEKSRLIFDLLARVRGRAETEIPTEPGVCFLGGFLPGKAGERENLVVQFVLRDKSDVSFDFHTDTNIQESTSLLERGDSINQVLKHNNGRTIRKGSVALPGMAAEEWLMAGTTTIGIPGHHLTLEANSKTGSPETPLVILDMDTATTNNVQQADISRASLTEGEAVALWDAVSKTLRPRQNGF